MNVLDLFSGIGGFSLGLERAGMRTVAFCERDEFCRAVLRKHWPDVPCWTDIRGIDADGLGRLGRVDLVCGGFPCQPFSVAGKQKAQEDDRHLWPEMRRIIALARPSWVIGENVAGIIPLALDDVLFDLEAIGYATRSFVIPACAVDAHHRRDRVWIVGSDTSRHRRQQGRASTGEGFRELGGFRNPLTPHAQCNELRDEPGWSSGADGPGPTQPGDDGPQESMAHSETEHGRRHERQAPESRRSSPPISYTECEQQGSSWRFGRAPESELNQWLAEPDVGRVAHGVPRRVDRLKSLGNAVVPQVVEEIGRAIMREHQ